MFETVSRKATQKTAEATDNSIGNKNADKIKGSSRTVPNKTELANFRKSVEIPREKCISPNKDNRLLMNLDNYEYVNI